MKELEKEFIGSGEVEGFKFRQIKTSPYGYVYEISNGDGKQHYETFERKESKKSERVIQGRAIQYEARIRYPKSGDFGLWAWCYRDKEKAIQKFDELNDRKSSYHAYSEAITDKIKLYI
jgi:hypothetical protein